MVHHIQNILASCLGRVHGLAQLTQGPVGGARRLAQGTVHMGATVLVSHRRLAGCHDVVYGWVALPWVGLGWGGG